jgi:hypothetical protein
MVATPTVKSKWIHFPKVRDIGKTSVFNVVNKETDFVLGEIKWYASFRKYSFFPSQNCVFETQCLRDIVAFIDALEQDRKSRTK